MALKMITTLATGQYLGFEDADAGAPAVTKPSGSTVWNVIDNGYYTSDGTSWTFVGPGTSANGLVHQVAYFGTQPTFTAAAAGANTEVVIGTLDLGSAGVLNTDGKTLRLQVLGLCPLNDGVTTIVLRLRLGGLTGALITDLGPAVVPATPDAAFTWNPLVAIVTSASGGTAIVNSMAKGVGSTDVGLDANAATGFNFATADNVVVTAEWSTNTAGNSVLLLGGSADIGG